MPPRSPRQEPLCAILPARKGVYASSRGLAFVGRLGRFPRDERTSRIKAVQSPATTRLPTNARSADVFQVNGFGVKYGFEKSRWGHWNRKLRQDRPLAWGQGPE